MRATVGAVDPDPRPIESSPSLLRITLCYHDPFELSIRKAHSRAGSRPTQFASTMKTAPHIVDYTFTN
ncbi:protein of unknown function [Candidatus Methylomirabilis oxygeniifera]|uniref:Uncharacterized protein n=1 Tax=Methylomirabilis oxygeniifera TaxID=671143 RepID=D5MJN1_METO1|nr:protein of unknown function [Candidatus Methylomirabilis oxyfera]